MVTRISERRDAEGKLTHIMCCLCFEYTPLDGLYVDSGGLRWNICTPCAETKRGEAWRARG